MLQEEVKQLVAQAKNICVIPNQGTILHPTSQQEPESLTAALALFYSLRELGKNVNVIAQEFPKNLQFLIPSLDFISKPKNFVISIPRALADVSQVYYEKNDDNLKIHLTIDKGTIKKDIISFYFSDAKPDLIITLGIPNFQKELEGNLNSFGFLLDSPIVNIDNSPENTKFGKINIIEETSLSQMVLQILNAIGETSMTKNTADCLFAGLVLYSDNFKNQKTNPLLFQAAAQLIQKGAKNQDIISNLQGEQNQETTFLGTILQNLETHPHQNISFALLNVNEFQDIAKTQISAAVEKIKSLGMPNDLLVLYKSHASAPMIKGFFYSKKAEQLAKISSDTQNDFAFIALEGEDINAAKDQIFAQLNKVF